MHGLAHPVAHLYAQVSKGSDHGEIAVRRYDMLRLDKGYQIPQILL